MQKSGLLACLAFLIPFLALPAQNWNPVPGAHLYLFQHPAMGSQAPGIRALRVDSMVPEGADSAWYFNRIARFVHPDSMVVGCNGPQNGGTNTWLAYGDNVLGRKMIRNGADYRFVSSSNDTFLLRTQVPAGTSWTFHSPSSVTATLDSFGVATFIGLTDSVMYISLSNGKQIMLSKTYGLAHAYIWLALIDTDTWQPVVGDLDLWGVPDWNAGDTLPGFADIYRFDVGDVFQFHHYLQAGIGGGYMDSWTTYTILSVNAAPGDTAFSYTATSQGKTINHPLFSPADTTYAGPTVITLNYSQAAYLSATHELLPAEAVIPDQLINDNQIFESGAHFAGDWNNRITYSFTGGLIADNCGEFFYPFESISYDGYAAGLGRTNWSLYSIEWTEYHNLLCYTKGTESWGQCENVIMDRSAASAQAQWTVFPNPASDELHLRSTIPSQRIKWQLLSVEGHVLMSGENTGTATLRIDTLPAGVYYLMDAETLTGQRVNIIP